ncbi:hypothetical protein [Vibrio phage JSF12]|uniref:Uncharacterized protein n=3 Tax=Jesfedecavirus TaxID=2560156 RepID=A0A2D0Z8K7_9CAUD|nr:hypothetical protein AVV29_gp069 [Vibrio phage phi 3]YP_009618505.1 hypothetical protein FDI98_gp054 [Vibrio phage JSF10]YP_009794786.1 hypothetical protein HOS35_gp103 [Vibrio phage JSF12]AJF40909.1 hypothetical protein SBVP3_00142 [Vibrio phage phi 3]ASV43478.1 hypothetical protein [Vibrio phage JSF10]ASV43621.1 hypothetical protein [Vibrio phage JSF12]
MAANTNKRVATKHIRDGIKSHYRKKDYCEICSTNEDLELHHYHTVSLLLKNYARENSIPISTDEQVLAMRDDFYKKYWHELVEDTVTLCNTHHVLLHKIYTQEPPLHTAEKQRNWVRIQRGRTEGLPDNLVSVTPSLPNYGESDLCKYMVQRLDISSFKV